MICSVEPLKEGKCETGAEYWAWWPHVRALLTAVSNLHAADRPHVAIENQECGPKQNCKLQALWDVLIIQLMILSSSLDKILPQCHQLDTHCWKELLLYFLLITLAFTSTDFTLSITLGNAGKEQLYNPFCQKLYFAFLPNLLSNIQPKVGQYGFLSQASTLQ